MAILPDELPKIFPGMDNFSAGHVGITTGACSVTEGTRSWTEGLFTTGACPSSDLLVNMVTAGAVGFTRWRRASDVDIVVGLFSLAFTHSWPVYLVPVVCCCEASASTAGEAATATAIIQAFVAFVPMVGTSL